jgi:pseudomonalisin
MGDAIRGIQPTMLPTGVKLGVPEISLGSARFIVALPLRNEAELDRTLAAISDPQSPQYRHFLSRSAFVDRYAPRFADLAAVAADLHRSGLAVSIMDQAVAVGGTQAQVERYFGTSFARTTDGVLSPRASMRVPNALTSRAAHIVGLSGEPTLRTFSRIIPAPAIRPDNFASALGPYFAVDFKEAYQMPSYQEATGAGATIAIVIAGTVKQSDLAKYFKNMHLPSPPVVKISKIGGGGTGGNGEATLDVEQSTGIAPGAKVVLYSIPTLGGQDIYNGYAAVVQGGIATVANSSFGGCEADWKSSLKTFDGVFKEGIASGVTWVASSGDHGADQCGSDLDGLGVSWPAVSPYVLAVGGTNLITNHTNGSNDSAYVRESAFKDIAPTQGGGNYWGSGGGYSKLYKRPSYQNGFVSKSGRGVPDVSLHMGGLGFSGSQCDAQKCGVDDSSDIELEGGKEFYAIGTSASGPDMVGLIALATQLANSPLGDVHGLLYSLAKKNGLFHRGIPGNNGYATTKGSWDPVLGLGTPSAAYKIIGAKTRAGTPGTSTNP